MTATPDPLAQPERVAFAGDWHMNAGWAERAIDYAKDQYADVIVHLGDFGYTFTGEFLREVSAELAFAGMELLFVDGNHESFPRLLRHPIRSNGLRLIHDGIWHLPRGFRWSWGGVDFLALGGAHSVDRPFRQPGISWWKEETITPEQAQRTIEGGPADVLIAHDCPAGVVIPGIDDRDEPAPFPPLEIMRSDEHRRLLRTVVDAVQPRLIFHGHYHTGYDTTAELGYGPVQVVGLDCDDTDLEDNVLVVSLNDIAAAVARDAAEVAR